MRRKQRRVETSREKRVSEGMMAKNLPDRGRSGVKAQRQGSAWRVHTVGGETGNKIQNVRGKVRGTTYLERFYNF